MPSDAIVIGAGVVGCAVARELSRYNLNATVQLPVRIGDTIVPNVADTGVDLVAGWDYVLLILVPSGEATSSSLQQKRRFSFVQKRRGRRFSAESCVPTVVAGRMRCAG